jgi:hypothetical protein
VNRGLLPGDDAELDKLRADFPTWTFNAVSGRRVAELHTDDSLIIVGEAGPTSLQARVEFYDRPG